MKKRKNMAAKIVAFIALFAIVLWVVGTWLLVVVSSPWNETEITQEQLQEYIDSLSGSTLDVNEDMTDPTSWSWASE